DSVHLAHGALVGARGHRRVGAQGLAHLARAYFVRRPGGSTAFFFLVTAALEFLVTDFHVDAAVRDVDLDDVAFADQTNGAAFSSLGRSAADGQAAGAAGETAVGEQ